MELPLLFVLTGTACLLLGGLTFKWMLIQDEKHPEKADKQQGNGCLGNLFIWLMIIGAILLIIGMMSRGSTGLGDPSYAPNWRGN
jgi:hypothetical protein